MHVERGLVSMSPASLALSNVASLLTLLMTSAREPPLAAGRAARYVGPAPANAVLTVKVLASISATRPDCGFAVHTQCPLTTGTRNV